MMDAMSDDDEIVVPGLPRKARKSVVAPSAAPSQAPGLFTVVATSAVTASIAAVVVVFALGRARPAMLASSVSALHAAQSSAPAQSAERAVAAEVTVPDLARIPAENVRAIVEAMGLRVIVNERREPSAIAAGLVAAQAPRAGSRLARGADVAVVISSGPSPTVAPSGASPAATGAVDAANPSADAVVVVPSVHRLFARDARGRLAAAGLSVGAQRRGGYDEDMSPGRILRQSPSAGSRVARGTAVDIWVNEE